jgi:hypothetical protein
MADMTKNTNTLVFAMIAGGLYYMKTKSEQQDETKEKKKNSEADSAESNNMAPFIVALLLIFSMREEIQNTLSKERVYNVIAISSAAYLITIEAKIIPILASIFASLILLPAVHEQTQ